jgi:DNA-binding response OmpR family regulator
LAEMNRKNDLSEPRPPARPAALGPPWGPDFRYAGALPVPPPKVRCGDLELDRIERRAVLAGSALRLTEREFTLLAYLAERADHAARRDDLFATIWGLMDAYGANVLDVYVGRLRRKFGTHAWMIRTIRGFGYCLRSEHLT